MPTSTLPFEVLLTFWDDVDGEDCITVQRINEGGSPNNTTVSLDPQECISLVLNAGATYRYLLVLRGQKARISCVPLVAASASVDFPPLSSVKIWKDTRISMTDVFGNEYRPLPDGITILLSRPGDEGE